MPDRPPPDPTTAAALPVGPAGRDCLLGELRRLEPELRRRGVRRLRLFGSVARGEADAASDVDLLAEMEPSPAPAAAAFSLLDLIALQHLVADEVGRPVQILTALHKLPPRVRAAVEADAIEVFGAAA